MIQRTYGQNKAELARVAGATGMSVSDPRVLERTNLAVQELLDTGDYPNVVDRWLFRADQHTGLVALPYMLDRLMQCTVDAVPDMIVSPWFEFVQYGPGTQDDFDSRGNLRRNWTMDIFDRGEMPVVTPIPDAVDVPTGPWVLRVYATVDEASGAQMNIRGLDTAGLIIRSQPDGTAGDWITGIDVDIDNGVPYVETTQEFSKITAIKKPETNGYVRLTAWNGTDEVELSNYAYQETEPSYRHYYIPRIHNQGVDGVRQKILLARCRKRFVPITEDDDQMIIGNINALKSMMVALWKRDAGDYEAYSIQKQTAIDILRKEAMGYTGKSRIPSFTMQKGFGLGSMPFVR